MFSKKEAEKGLFSEGSLFVAWIIRDHRGALAKGGLGPAARHSSFSHFIVDLDIFLCSLLHRKVSLSVLDTLLTDAITVILQIIP